MLALDVGSIGMLTLSVAIDHVDHTSYDCGYGLDAAVLILFTSSCVRVFITFA
jgi:hypothetical protein